MTSKIRYAVLGFVAVALLASVLVAASGASGKTVAVAATPELQRVGKQVEVRPAVQLETGWAAPGTEVAVAVTAGPSAVADLDGKAATRAGYAGTCTGEGESSCTVGYTGRRPGIDVVTAWIDSNGDGVPSTGEPSGTVSVRWVKRLVRGKANLALGRSAVSSLSPLVITGSVHAAPPCRIGRAVRLERRRPSATVWEQLGAQPIAAGGTYGFRLTPEENAVYRAVIERGVRSGVGCARILSPEQTGVVRAQVKTHARSSEVAAGDCTTLAISVAPNKSGQVIRVQRRRGSGWVRVADTVLDPLSRATTRVCFPWSSLGRVQLRAVWPKQDRSNASGSSAATAVSVRKAWWMRRIDRLAAGLTIGIAIRSEGRFLYERADRSAYIPASNEKLLLSMALLDRFGPQFRLPTGVAIPSLRNGVVRNLWILGSGNPAVRGPTIAALARSVASAGVRRIRGSVMGSTGYFARDWWAPGWKSFFPEEDIALPTALTFRGNEVNGTHVRDPERRAAQALTTRLRSAGVAVRGTAGSGLPPGGLQQISVVQSRPLAELLRRMNHDSDNFYAEVLGKRLGVETYGAPGTIARGAAAIASWIRGHGVRDRAYDSSGLSYGNRIAPAGVTRLLQVANHEPWGPILRNGLAAPGERGTLKDRLKGIRVRAKTGTLEFVSALSGWVWLRRLGTWAEFSIMSRGMYADQAKSIEDSIVRLTTRYGH